MDSIRQDQVPSKEATKKAENIQILDQRSPSLKKAAGKWNQAQLRQVRQGKETIQGGSLPAIQYDQPYFGSPHTAQGIKI